MQVLADHASSLGRHYKVSKQNSIADTSKQRILFIFATREEIDFYGVGMATRNCLFFMIASVHSSCVWSQLYLLIYFCKIYNLFD